MSKTGKCGWKRWKTLMKPTAASTMQVVFRVYRFQNIRTMVKIIHYVDINIKFLTLKCIYGSMVTFVELYEIYWVFAGHKDYFDSLKMTQIWGCRLIKKLVYKTSVAQFLLLLSLVVPCNISLYSCNKFRAKPLLARLICAVGDAGNMTNV